jgi:hypothetical protein
MVAINSAAQQPFQTARKPDNPFDEVIRRNSDRMLEEGQRIFRFDIVGDEAFWGGVLSCTRPLKGSGLAVSGGL